MPQIKKILFPVDFSAGSLATARHVEAMAGHFEANIQLLHVVERGELTLPEELLPLRQAKLDAYLTEELKYFSTERRCVVGDAAIEIKKAACSWHPDLVMMPTHGLGTFRRLLLGSVTAKVLDDLSCPVWTSSHAESPLPLEDIHCRRILCAVDLAERSQSVLEWAAWLASEYGAALAVVHATAELPPSAYGWNLEEDYQRSMGEQAKRRIEILQTAVTVPAEIFVANGNAGKVVAGAAATFQADLLVLGRHGGTGISGYLRPHAYSILRESPCPAISI
jgi:nucleotide-binding universal stress UspA family protein